MVSLNLKFNLIQTQIIFSKFKFKYEIPLIYKSRANK